jgi:WD40 repeat protein
LRIWDLAHPDAPPTRLPGHDGPVHALSLAPSGELASGGVDGAFRVWDLSSGTSRVVGHVDGELKQLAFVDGGRTAIGLADRAVVQWDVATGAREMLLELPDVSRRMSISTDETTIAACGNDGLVHTLDRATGARQELAGHIGPCRLVAFSPDGEWLASAGQDGTVRIWSLAVGAGAIVHRHAQAVRSMQWSSDGAWLATSSNDGTAWIGAGDRVSILPASPAELLEEIDARTSAEIDDQGYMVGTRY